MIHHRLRGVQKGGEVSSNQWRILATSGSVGQFSGSDYFQMGEFELYALSGASGTNLAVSGTASASSFFGTNFEASKTNNGIQVESGWSTTTGSCNGEWLQITLGSSSVIKSCQIYRRGTHLDLFPATFDIQAYVGSSWVTVNSFSYSSTATNPITYEIQ